MISSPVVIKFVKVVILPSAENRWKIQEIANFHLPIGKVIPNQYGQDIPRPHWRAEAVLVRGLRNQSDQQTGTDQHQIYGGHWEGLPVQTGRQFDLLSGAGSGHAHRTAHGSGRDVQELQGQTRMDVRICHRGISEVSVDVFVFHLP